MHVVFEDSLQCISSRLYFSRIFAAFPALPEDHQRLYSEHVQYRVRVGGSVREHLLCIEGKCVL